MSEVKLARKELQALCKKHGVKANGKTAEMAAALREKGVDLGAATAGDDDHVDVEEEFELDVEADSSSSSSSSTSSSSNKASSKTPTSSSMNEVKVEVTDLPPTAEERLKARALRFGNSDSGVAGVGTDSLEAILDKKRKRAERFGITMVQSESEKKKLRAERFQIKNKEQLEAEAKKKLQLRAKRFGGSTTESEKKKQAASSTTGAAPSGLASSKALQDRAKRFGMPLKGTEEEERKKREERKERFKTAN
ncbi:SAP domain-containing protein [Balamuthia mandrillaris]